MKEILKHIIHNQLHKTDVKSAYSLLNSYIISNNLNIEEDPKLKLLYRNLDIFAGLTEGRAPEPQETQEIEKLISDYIVFLESSN